jgi:hypothetical protein
VIFSRLRALNWLPGIRLRHSLTPGISLGRYESGLEAVWAWQECAHLLVVERDNYGAGENLVRLVARKYDGDCVQLDPKVWRDEEYHGARDRPPWWFVSLTSCATQMARLNLDALLRAARIEQGEDVAPMLVTIPELHDVLELATLPEDYDESEAGKSLLNGLLRLLQVGRAARIHVLVNIRQGYFYKVHMPQGLLKQFSGLLVLGRTSRTVTEKLSLPPVFSEPRGHLGDLGNGFWPLEVRLR